MDIYMWIGARGICFQAMININVLGFQNNIVEKR